MKLFSSFDTSYKKQYVAKKQKVYGAEKVHVLKRSKFFLMFYGIIPMILVTLASGVLGYICHYYMGIPLSWSVGIAIFTWIIGTIYYNIIRHIIDYKMDYCIITPDEIISADQTWLFKRQIRTLDAIKIKSISVKRLNTMNSIFNNGMIVFMSDGDEKLWEISMSYVYNPEMHKTIIVDIIN